MDISGVPASFIQHGQTSLVPTANHTLALAPDYGANGAELVAALVRRQLVQRPHNALRRTWDRKGDVDQVRRLVHHRRHARHRVPDAVHRGLRCRGREADVDGEVRESPHDDLERGRELQHAREGYKGRADTFKFPLRRCPLCAASTRLKTVRMTHLRVGGSTGHPLQVVSPQPPHPVLDAKPFQRWVCLVPDQTDIQAGCVFFALGLSFSRRV
ncbi:hypothetical protein C8Q80DRAFT_613865 [Daedaleopsis nitida]|nr:hypothetical protein C8Q80DRAFT_613865 [Daedaleopsis nitida]